MKNLWRKFTAWLQSKVDWLVVKMTFDIKYIYSEDQHAITAVREWGPFKFQYGSYFVNEFFYIAVGERTFYRHEVETEPPSWYQYDHH